MLNKLMACSFADNISFVITPIKTSLSAISALSPLIIIIINSIFISLLTILLILMIRNRKKTGGTAADNREFMKKVFCATQTGIIVLEKESETIIDANNYALNLSRYSSSGLKGKKISSVLSSDLPYKNIGNKQLFDIEGKIITKSGDKIPVIRNITSILLNGKQYYLESFIDNTKRKQFEEETEYAINMAEKANKSKSEFLANMSHEFRTPMNAIIGISKSILKYDSKGLTGEQVEGLRHISQSGIRLLDLVNDLLDVAKIESGKTTVTLNPFPLDKLIIDLKSMVEELIKGKNIRFYVRKNPDIPETIISDSRKLYQILTNLLSNSVKFTHKGKIQLRIHKLDEFLYFEVEDTGIGIAKENLTLIFEKFAQIDSSDQKKYKGTGLGLALCKNLVELLGGTINVESEPDKGTLMKFSIPFRTLQHNLKEKDFSLINGVQENKTDIKNRILIIENDAETRYYYDKYLRDNSFQLIFAKDGKEGLKKVFQILPEIIILTLKLPGMTGYEILRKIKFNSETCSIPVIIVTELDNNPSKAIYNYEHILHKPVEIKDLMSMITRLLGIKDIQKNKVIIISENVNELEHLIMSLPDENIVTITIQESRKALNLIQEIKPHIIIFDAENSAISEGEFINKFKNSEYGKTASPLIILYKTESVNKMNESGNIKDITKSADSLQKLNDLILQYSQSVKN